MGRPFMPWQRYVADVSLEVLPSGRFAYQLVIVTVPRQSGKTTLFGAAMEHRALVTPAGRVWFCQQTGKDAVDWLINEHAPTLAVFGDHVHIRRAQGSEHIKWLRSEGLVRPFPPSADALHSKATDLVVVDEAWAQDLVRGRAIDQGIVPTQATKPNSQVWKLSTAGDDSSIWWLGTVETGRAAVKAGRDTGIAFFEWACPDDLDPTAEESWPVFHPAYGLTIGPEQMRAALELLGPDEFARAYGNRWVATTARVIPVAVWAARRDEAAELPAAGGLALAFDVAIDSSDASIVAAWRDGDGVGHVEVADHRPATGWVPERLAELVARWRPVAVAFDQAGPVVDVADRAARGGVALEGLAARDYAAACERFLRGLEDGSLRYRPHPALDDAAGAAGKRAVGDAWAWGRRQTTISISALTAATCALWAWDHAPAELGEFRIL
jgi:hypothetical protein